MLKVVFYSSIFIFQFSTFASCAGLKNCNSCFDSLRGTEREDVICQKDDDCIAVSHRCDGFFYLNKKNASKYIDKNLKNEILKNVPNVQCKLHLGWQEKVCQALH